MEKIKVSAWIEATKEKVWDYYTNPEHIVNWNFADPSWHCPKVSNELKVGGLYFARMEARDGSFGFDFEAEYTEVKLHTSFTYLFGGRCCTVTFDQQDNTTIVTIGFDPETENPIDLQKSGWQAILDNFKVYVESI